MAGFTFTQPATTGGLTFGTPKTTGGFTFGTNTAATTTKGLTFNLGTSTTTAPTLGTGLFGTQKTDGVTITSTTTTSVGLGGINNAQSTPGLSGSGPMEPKQAKDHALPDPILQTLNDFQNFTKQQKSISVEISHGSSKPLKKVQEDTEAIESLLTTITSGLTKNAIAVDKLKTETAQGLHQAEMAQRNHETPPGLEYDSSAPSDYFNDLVTKFETDTARLRAQIEASEKHLKSLTQCSTVSPQELTLAMRRLHETLIVLAARVQTLHTTVQSQKEQFKNLRRVYFKDDTNIFESGADQSRAKKQTMYSLRSLTGPTPFSESHGPGIPLNVDGLAMLSNSATAYASVPTTTSNATSKGFT
ncbi:hypothetical protein RUM44_007746 [Polyplax serrata]|uniref:Nucleoporin Nup58 n=1 Tax=Polyplax serrata TaxID=468196 RepID=A0ABR1BAF6_POLSC